MSNEQTNVAKNDKKVLLIDTSFSVWVINFQDILLDSYNYSSKITKTHSWECLHQMIINYEDNHDYETLKNEKFSFITKMDYFFFFGGMLGGGD